MNKRTLAINLTLRKEYEKEVTIDIPEKVYLYVIYTYDEKDNHKVISVRKEVSEIDPEKAMRYYCGKNESIFDASEFVFNKIL